MVINYTYTDLGRQMIILDLGAPVSIAGVSWMKQYLEGFNLEIDDMKSVSCNQPFVFGPSKRYVCTSLVELLILVTKMDGRGDVLPGPNLSFLALAITLPFESSNLIEPSIKSVD